MRLINVLISLLSCVSHVISQLQCPGTCYSGSFPKNNQITKGKHLRGYSYKNITTDVPHTCFSSCINDCRCKAFQMKDVRCELVDEDKTSKAADFVDETGYVYYDLQQKFFKGKSHMVHPASVCYNGCCRTKPCMNGGTCEEHCEKPKVKFSCKCPATYKGKICEKREFSSCIDVFKGTAPGTMPANGTYIITRSDTKTTLPVYCAFESPNKTWTLIESFSLQNEAMYTKKAFHQNFPRNFLSQFIQWGDYRQPLDMMKYFRAKAIMFSSTCDYPNRPVNYLASDSLLGYLSDFDIIDNGDVDGKCIKFAYINIRGQEFFNVTAGVWHKVDKYHFHIDCHEATCEELYLTDSEYGDDCFGYYKPLRSGISKCTATQQSTTQWWLGEQQ